jgi:PAS domain S-box-containing protein
VGGETPDERSATDRLRFLRAAFDSSGDGVIVVDARGFLVYVNEAGHRLIGPVVSPDLPITDQLSAFRPRYPDGRPMAPGEVPLARAIHGESFADYLIVARKPDGSDAHFRNTVNPVRDESDRIIGAVSIFRDVSDQMRIESVCLRLIEMVRQANERLTMVDGEARERAEEARAALARARTAELVSREVRESEERFRTLATVAPVGIFRADVSGDCIDANLRLSELSGLSPEQLRGRGWTRALHPEGRESFAATWYEEVAVGREFTRECRFAPPDGRVTWVSVRAAPFRNQDGTVAGYIGAVTDITERKLAEAERERLLAEVEHRAAELDAIVEGMAEGLIVIDPTENVVRINRAALRIIGADSAAAFPRYHMICEGLDVRSRDGAPLPVESRGMSRALRGEELVEQEILIHSADDKEKLLSSTSSPVRDDSGRIILAVGIYRDVTREREIESERERLLVEERAGHAEFERQVAQMKALLWGLGEAVTIVDASGRLVLRNEASREISGLTDDEMQRRLDGHGLVLEHTDGKPIYFAQTPIGRALRGEQFTDEEYTMVRPDGERRRVVMSGTAVRDESGEVAMGLVVFRDVTELRELERMKDDYVSLISHDLRNPLTVVTGQIDWLRRLLARKGQASEAGIAENALKSARRMNVMIQDLVESARLESGQLELHKESTNLLQLVADIAERVGTLEDRARIRVEGAAWVPPVLADPNRLERAIVNLITNALKFSSADRPVVVRVGRSDGEATVSVVDHGAGIPPEEMPRLFQRFSQARAGKRAGGGLGLGLYITRLIVEAHGGRVWAESEVDRGSTFTFTIPLT